MTDLSDLKRPMQGYEPDGAPIDSNYHGWPHEYDARVCDVWPKCRDIVEVTEPMPAAPTGQRYTTLDSGQRQEYASGMRRDVEEGKARFDLIFPEGIAYGDQMLTRFAELLARGAEKYGENNWQNANSLEEYRRFKRSGLRHYFQWMSGEVDEDHAAAVFFNIMAAEYTKRKLEPDAQA